MKILIAPLNWGLGHATRCIPLVRQHLTAGDEVVLGGDGDSLLRLRQAFPDLRYIHLAPLHLRYSSLPDQRGFYLRTIPQLVYFTLLDHYRLRSLLAVEHFDLVISDNRFGLFSRHTRCVYMTHQLYVRMPRRLRFLQPLVCALHRNIYHRYDEVWVPDYASVTHNLSGALSHGGKDDNRIRYIGPLSRLESCDTKDSAISYDIVVLISGPEPYRTKFENSILNRYAHHSEQVLLVRGVVAAPRTRIVLDNITLVPHIDDSELCRVLLAAKHIIARSGYSTIMDLEHLHLLDKAELHPTPAQPEQEYLACHITHINNL